MTKRIAAVHKSECGTSRHFAATQQFSRFRSEADIQRAAITEPDLWLCSFGVELFQRPRRSGDKQTRPIEPRANSGHVRT
jgi:hypothetical protein